jgi:hypothetical protein
LLGGKSYSQDLGIDGKMLLKYLKETRWERAGLIWLRIAISFS